jgi:hypothetical protein
MQFIKEFKDIDITELTLFLQKCDQTFETSQLYNSARDEKFVDPSLRLSKYRAIVNDDLFNISDKILKNITNYDEYNSYSLVKNDITHIVYEKGGFFKQHRDFLSLKSNIIEEYTLLICVTPHDNLVTVGGETVIHVNPDYIHTSKSTITPGCALLFRKDLVHEGLVIEQGNKEIVTMNIWVTRKATMNDEIILIKFLNSDNSNDADPVLSAAYDQSYAVSANQVMKHPKSLLSAFYNFNKKNDIHIYEYKCDDLTYEQFYVIYNVICGSHISFQTFTENKELLDYYGFSPSDILVDFLGTDDTVTIPDLDNNDEICVPKTYMGLGEKCCSRCNKSESITKLFNCKKCDKIQYCSRNCQVNHWSDVHKYECCNTQVSEISEDDDFILCCSEEKCTTIAELSVKSMRPYVRFSIVFVEGVKSFGGEMDGTEPAIYKMQPVWASFGDHNNVLYRSVLSTRSNAECLKSYVDLKDIIANNYTKTFNDGILEENKDVMFANLDDFGDGSDDEDEEDYHIRYNMYDYQDDISFGLNISYPAKLDLASFTKLLLPDHHDKKKFEAIILPGINKTRFNEYFSIDEDDNTCFTAKQAELLTKYIKDSKFIDRVKSKLNTVNFQLPQVTDTTEQDFCNESIYGQFNFILATGLICPGKHIY